MKRRQGEGWWGKGRQKATRRRNGSGRWKAAGVVLAVENIKVDKRYVGGGGRGAGFAGNKDSIMESEALLSSAAPALSPICLMLHSSSLTSDKGRVLAHGQRRQHDM